MNPDRVDAVPLVSILIPTHNRPDYAELALRSALAQNYANFEVVVSDNSDDERTAERFAPYVASYPQLRYLRIDTCPPMENFDNCYRHARGDYISFLMDDDLFHPDKLNRMMSVMIAQPNVGLVTSFRQLIDGEGNFLQAVPGTERLFQSDTLIGGTSLGDLILTQGSNLVGEPTTALFRKNAAGTHFGEFLGKQYGVLSDVATWLSVLSQSDCAYLSDPLSYFRIHSGQDQQRGNVIRIHANVEWLQLLCDALEHHKFMRNAPAIRDMLTSKLVSMISFLSSLHEEIKAGAYDVEKIQSVIRQATGILLGAPQEAP